MDVASINTPTFSSDISDLETTFPTVTLPPGELPQFPYSPGELFADIEEVNWENGHVSYTDDVPLPVSLENIVNQEVIAGLTSRQQSFLESHGFVVLHSQEEQFLYVHERVSLRYGQPYFLTTDAAFHALHLTLAELLAALEREELLPRMAAITQATLSMVDSYLPLVQGTSLEADTLLAAAYLGVALRLFDPQATMEPQLDQQVTNQVAQIRAGRGVEVSTLIPNFHEDFSAYRPMGHYAGDPYLEGYFLGMTWLSRVNYNLQSQNPDSTSQINGIYSSYTPSRAPLVLTLALRQAHTGDGSAAQEWTRVQEVLDYLLGPSLDLSPAEYAGLMDQIYGHGITIIDLFDEDRWQAFQTLAPVLPSTQINSVFLKSLENIEIGRGWRFMGRRFNLDDYILQNLVYDRVGTVDKMRETASGYIRRPLARRNSGLRGPGSVPSEAKRSR